MFSLKNLFSKFRNSADRSQTAFQYYLSVCCIVKDENDYLEEWIDYHQKTGVQHFFIYDNGSKIPVRSVPAIQQNNAITVIEMPGKNQHVKAYQHCLNKFGRLSRWIAFIDVDEFIVPKTENLNLPEFLQKYENYGGLGISWLIFGSNGHTQKPAGRQIENFTKRSDIGFLPNRHIKSIVQPAHVSSAFKSHCFKYNTGFYCVNEHFTPIEGATADVSVDTIQLNHYYCRSLEEYHQKVERGISDTKRKRKLEEFYNHDAGSNQIEDRTILDILLKLDNSAK